MKLSRMLMSVLIVAACVGARSAPRRPWRIEVSTTGGMTGRGTGNFAVDSDGNVDVRRMNGEACTYAIAKEELDRIEALLGAAEPRKWRESYLPENTCCDRVIFTLKIDEDGDISATRWLDAPPQAPKDLFALADAIVGPEHSLRADSAEHCK